MIRKVGGNKYIPIDIRIVAATNEPPRLLVNEGRLREDLFYRLGVVQIDLPPLAERKEDIEILVNYFIGFYNRKMNITISDICPKVMDKFYKYDWPGNIRELKNAIEAAYNNVTSSKINLDDIPQRIRSYDSLKIIDDYENNNNLSKMLEQNEKQIILNELKRTNYKKSQTAKNLGISKQLLNYKINKYLI